LPFVQGFNRPGFLILALTLASGVIPLGRRISGIRFRPTRAWIGLAAVALIPTLSGLAVALAPMADADTLAYHYPLAKWAVASGAPVFIPRAADGAVPQLVEMTYAAAMALGGGYAANLWVWVSTAMLGALLYTSARRWLAPTPALATALLIVTLPAMVYGGVSGQIEVRMTLFSLVLALAVADTVRTGRIGFAIVAGLAAGVAAGSKYTGLLLVASAGVTLILFAPRRPKLLLAFALAALAAGWQWYWWMWRHTGDPVFPMLWGHVAYHAGFPWNDEQQAYFKQFSVLEWSGVPRSLASVVTYPWRATFSPLPGFDSDRTGFGPLGFLLVPFALLGVWRRRRRRLPTSALTILTVIAVLEYLAWMGLGPSLRVRHLLPEVPLILLPLAVAAVRGLEWRPAAARPLVAGIGAVLLLNLAAASAFSANAIRYLASTESPEAFLDRNLPGFEVVPWTNATLGPDDRLLLFNRTLAYYLEVPQFLGHEMFQAEVELRPGLTDPVRLWAQMRRAGITHTVLQEPLTGRWAQLAEQGCLVPVARFTSHILQSRSLPALGGGQYHETAFALNRGCVIAASDRP